MKNILLHERINEAAAHLIYLAGGLKSQILGEDQILTQIKDALNLAREHLLGQCVGGSFPYGSN